MGEIITRVINLPRRVNAMTVMDENDDYNIYLNANLSYIEMKKAFFHEIEHIKKGHFLSKVSVKKCEIEAGKYFLDN